MIRATKLHWNFLISRLKHIIGDFKTHTIHTLHESKTTIDIKNPQYSFVENTIRKLHSEMT